MDEESTYPVLTVDQLKILLYKKLNDLNKLISKESSISLEYPVDHDTLNTTKETRIDTLKKISDITNHLLERGESFQVPRKKKIPAMHKNKE